MCCGLQESSSVTFAVQFHQIWSSLRRLYHFVGNKGFGRSGKDTVLTGVLLLSCLAVLDQDFYFTKNTNPVFFWILSCCWVWFDVVSVSAAAFSKLCVAFLSLCFYSSKVNWNKEQQRKYECCLTKKDAPNEILIAQRIFVLQHCHFNGINQNCSTN